MKLVFMGTPLAAVPSLSALVQAGHEVIAVYTQPDRPSGRGNKIVPTPVKEAALQLGIKVLQPEKIRTGEAAAQFRAFEADAAIVVAYGRILPPEFLYAFPKGAINVHFSLLPKYRGAAPVNWAIANGERYSGVTTMKMNEGLDTGDMLVQQSVEIGTNETSIHLMQRLSTLGAEALIQTLDSFDEIDPVPQNEAERSLAPIMYKDDGAIDWNLTASQINDRIRGFQPFPGSFSFIDDKRIKFWSARPEPESHSNIPGTILTADKDALSVACGGGSVISIIELQGEGARRMSVSQYLAGNNIRSGSRFNSDRS